MITFIKEVNIKEETRSIVLALQKDQELVQELDAALNHRLLTLEERTVVHTLGLIKSPKIYVYEGKDLCSDFTNIASLKGEFVVLIDTFTQDEKAAKSFSEIVEAKQNAVSMKSEKKMEDSSFFVYSNNGDKELQEGKIIGEAISFTKHLVDLPNNYLNAVQLADIVEKNFRGKQNVEVKILKKKEIQDLQMGLFLGVNQGSVIEPRLIVIKYQGKDRWEDPLCFIGKGITFDTGGYTLKTSMVGMKDDMAGGAAVVGAAKALIEFRVKENLLFLVGATDNRLGEHAIVPDDVLTSMAKKTVEIVSTDAEGRLVLADVITYAQSLGAKKLIDIATLTGSMASTFGDKYTGAFTNDGEFLQSLIKAGKNVKESIWPMPLDDEYFTTIYSKVADFKNSAGKVPAGACIAAIFLKQFIKESSKWIHLDIAGTATKDGSATGVMVKTFIEFARTAQ